MPAWSGRHTNQRDDKREAGVAQTTQGTGHDNRNAEQRLGNGNDAQHLGSKLDDRRVGGEDAGKWGSKDKEHDAHDGGKGKTSQTGQFTEAVGILKFLCAVRLSNQRCGSVGDAVIDYILVC